MSDSDDMRELWKQQPLSVPEVDMIAIEKKATEFAAQIRRRNLSEWIAAALVVVGFLVGALVDDDLPSLTRVGAVLIALGAAFVAHRLRRHGRVREAPDAAQDTQKYIAAYRENLDAQAALLHAVPRWYLAPLVPGLMAFYLGFIVADPTTWPAIVVLMALSLAFFAVIGWFNIVAARKLRAQSAELMHDP